MSVCSWSSSASSHVFRPVPRSCCTFWSTTMTLWLHTREQWLDFFSIRVGALSVMRSACRMHSHVLCDLQFKSHPVHLILLFPFVFVCVPLCVRVQVPAAYEQSLWHCARLHSLCCVCSLDLPPCIWSGLRTRDSWLRHCEFVEYIYNILLCVHNSVCVLHMQVRVSVYVYVHVHVNVYIYVYFTSDCQTFILVLDTHADVPASESIARCLYMCPYISVSRAHVHFVNALGAYAPRLCVDQSKHSRLWSKSYLP